LKVACLQLCPELGQKEKNLRRLLEALEEASALGAELCVAPELSITGFSCGSLFPELAEPIPGPSVKAVAEMAQKRRLYVAFGLPEKEPATGVIYNSAVLVGPDGKLLGRYRKTHLSLYLRGPLVSEEAYYFRRGEALPVFTTPLGGVGLLICQDGDFPESWRTLCLLGARLVLFLSASPKEFGPLWYSELSTMAYQNGFFIVAANRGGIEEFEFSGRKVKLEMLGGSLVADPYGRIVARAPEGEQALLTAEIDLGLVDKARQESCLLRDRRPELYGPIAGKPA
jgi:predicted amidohydrolase